MLQQGEMTPEKLLWLSRCAMPKLQPLPPKDLAASQPDTPAKASSSHTAQAEPEAFSSVPAAGGSC